MDENNKEANMGNSPTTNFNPPKGDNSKLILLLVGVLVVILVIGFFVYKNYFSENSALVENQQTQEITIKAGYSLYQDVDTAISFQYPQTLSLLDKDEDGSKMLPNIFFQSYQYPSGYSRNACPVDCINFSAFIRPGNGLPHYDIPLQIERNNPQFPIYDYPQYVYQDETGSKPFQINGMETVRYYATGLTDSYVNAYARDKTTPVEYTLEDRVFIKDPNLSERVIYIVYQEKTNKLPASAQSLSPATIKSLFNPQKYAEFQDILASVKALPIDVNQFVTQSSKQLGVSFQAPKYYGALVESTGGAFGSEPKIETVNLYFKSPLFSWDDPARIRFEADNSKTANYVYEGLPPLYQYFGQSLDTACQKNAYLDSSGSYDIKITECNLRTLPSGVKVVVFKGNFAYKYEYGEGEIPAAKRQPIPFKAAMLKTKSSKWPGMSIHFEGTSNFNSIEKIFDKIIDSLSSSSIVDSNAIIKNSWGVSFSKSSDWEVTSDSEKELVLKQTSGEWTGDTIDISYISAPNITTTDAKFGSVTYYFDANKNQWTKIGQSEKTGDNESPVPATEYVEYPRVDNTFPVFVGTNRWLTLIVPLSHTTFLKLHITGSGQTQPLKDLLRTIKKI